MDDREQQERRALQILLMAAERYLKTQDDLGKMFITPQAQSAVEILTSVLNERWEKPEGAAEAG